MMNACLLSLLSTCAWMCIHAQCRNVYMLYLTCCSYMLTWSCTTLTGLLFIALSVHAWLSVLL